MGITSWLVSGLTMFALARIIPTGRGRWWSELIVMLVTALVCGFAATALDFGGWRELDWRAAAFCAAGALVAGGIGRNVMVSPRKANHRGRREGTESSERAG